jgi:Secretion system C-terminal sorting domain
MRKKLLLFLFVIAARCSLIAQPYVYNFDGDFTGTGPTLTPILSCAAIGTGNGSFTSQPITTTCTGTVLTQNAYDFNEGEGLVFDNNASLIGGTYTIQFLFRFNAYPLATYQRLIDFSDSAFDFGFYVYQDCIHLSFNGPPACPSPTFVAGTYYLATITRDVAGLVSVYIDGILLDSYDDSGSNIYVPGTSIILFHDDVVSPCENGAGSIRYFSLSPVALTAPVVAAAAAGVCAVVLPLSLVDFSAEKQNSTVALKWATESEVNMSHFELERSADGRSFSKLTSVPANNTSSRSNYNFVDRQPLTGTDFYRLKIMDIDGHFKYSGILKINFNSTTKFEVFPNPAKESVTISGILGNKMVKLLNVEGKELIQKVSTGQTMTLDLNKYPSGVYIITYSDGETIQRQKIIKN